MDQIVILYENIFELVLVVIEIVEILCFVNEKF